MKKLTKILIIALSIALLCGAFIFGASAETAPQATTENAFEVTNADGSLVGNYKTLGEAFANVSDGGKITVTQNAEDGPTLASGTLGAGKNVTLDLNGKTIAASYATNGDSISYQKYYISGSLTVVGKGTIKAGTSAFVVANGASLTFDAGEGKTINLVATKSYDMSGAASSNTFPGLQFVKIGSNGSYNTNRPTVTVKGNLNFTNESGKESAALFGLFSGARLNISDADITAMTPNASSSFIINYSMSASTPYDADKYIGPEVTINNSNIEYPYGHFFMNAATLKVGENEYVPYTTDYSDAVSLTVTDSTLNLYGDNYPAPNTYGYGDIYVNVNTPNKIVMTGTKVVTDSNFYRCDTQSDVVPNTTVELTDCDITIEIYQGAQTAGEYNYRRKFFTGIVTAIVDDTVLAHSYASDANTAAGRVIRYTHAWCDGDTAKAAGRVDPGYFDKLGMGVLFKEGTTFFSKRSNNLETAVAPGAHHGTYSGYAYENGTSLATKFRWINDVPRQTNVLVYTDNRPTDLISNTLLAYNSFGGSTVGTINSGGTFGGTSTALANSTARGKYTICKSDDGNKYFTFQSSGNKGGDPYVSISYGGGTKDFGNRAINKIRYYSYEFDMASTVYNYSDGTFEFGFLFRVNGSAQYLRVKFVADGNGTRWTYTAAGSDQVFTGSRDVTIPGVWQHYQIILEAPVDANGAFDYANAGNNFKVHLYVNGKKISEAKLSDMNSAIANAIVDRTSATAIDLDDIGLSALWLRVPNSTNTAGVTAMDNLLATTYPITYTGNLDSVVTDSTEYVLPKAFSVFKSEGAYKFEDAEVGTYNDGTNVSAGGSYGSGVDANGFRDRRGRYTVCEYGTNKYITHVAQEGTNEYKSDPFLSTGYKNGSKNADGIYRESIETIRFYSYEFDIAPAELRYSQGTFGPRFFFQGDTGVEYVGVLCDTDANGKTVWKAGSKTLATFDAAEVAANAGKWQHAQVILEAPVANGAFDTKNAANFQIHLYLDGELVGSASLSQANSTLAGKLATLTDFTKVGIAEVRFRFPTGFVSGDKGSTALDNLATTRYFIGYTGGKTTNADILNSVVNTNYTKLANLPVVNVNGEDFSDVDAAFTKLVTLANAGNAPTLTYKMNISSLEFDPVKYGLTKNASFNVATGGKSLLKLPALSGYTTADKGSGSYTVSAEFATVTWQDKDGATLRTDKVIKGTEISAYAIDNPQKVPTDYYVATYNYWKLGEKFVKFEDTVAIDSDVTATPVASLVSNFVDFRLNIELNDNLCIWYYLPTDFLNNKVEGITFTGAVYGTETEAKTFSGEMEIDENTYAYFKSYQGYNAFTTQFKWTISYDVVFDGLTYHLSREFGVSPLSYAEYILSDKTDTFTAQEKGHIANFVRTANEFMRAYNGKGEHVAVINTVYETYKHLCSEYETNLLANTGLELGDLSLYISSIYLKISSGRAQYSIDFKENSGVRGVKLVKKGVGGEMAGVDIVVGSYGNEKYSDDSYKTFNTNALKFYNFFGTLNITLTVDDGNGGTKQVTGTYDINSWYNNARFNDEDEKAMWRDLLMAMKELGDSTFDYRFERVED